MLFEEMNEIGPPTESKQAKKKKAAAKNEVGQKSKLEELLSLFGVDDIRHLPEAVLSVVLSEDRDRREEVYRQFLEMHRDQGGVIDLSKDLFQDVYETDLAERNSKKQDFTPYQVSQLAARLVNASGCKSAHEPTAGNGSMIIAAWYEHIMKTRFCEYRPSGFKVDCFELSSRSIPLLLLNLSLRGMTGEVVHGDVLELKAEAVYLLVNVEDDALAFSEVIKIDKDTDLEQLDDLVRDRCNQYISWKNK